MEFGQKEEWCQAQCISIKSRGLNDVIAVGIPHVEIYVSVSETHSMKNSGATVEQALSEATKIIETAKNYGLTVTVGVMCAFGCFHEGLLAPKRLRDMILRFKNANPDEMSLADTAGSADPSGIARMLEILKKS